MVSKEEEEEEEEKKKPVPILAQKHIYTHVLDIYFSLVT